MLYIVELENGETEIRNTSSLKFNTQNILKEKIQDKKSNAAILGKYIKKTEIYSYQINLSDYIKNGKIEFMYGTTHYHYKNNAGKKEIISAFGQKGKKEKTLWYLHREKYIGALKSCFFLDTNEYGKFLSNNVSMHIVRNVPLDKESAFEMENASRVDWFLNDYMQQKFKSHLPL